MLRVWRHSEASSSPSPNVEVRLCITHPSHRELPASTTLHAMCVCICVWPSHHVQPQWTPADVASHFGCGSSALARHAPAVQALECPSRSIPWISMGYLITVSTHRTSSIPTVWMYTPHHRCLTTRRCGERGAAA